MKRTWLGFVVSLAFILSGCGTVVYQVRPDAPPMMGYEEAMEAMELALSMMNKGKFVDVTMIDGGIMTKSGYITYSNPFIIRYGDVGRQVRKLEEKEYHVRAAAMHISYGTSSETFSWRSLKDARLFVDAAYILSAESRRTARAPGKARKAPSLLQTAKKEEPAPTATAAPPVVQVSSKTPTPPPVATAPAKAPEPFPVARTPVEPPKPAVPKAPAKRVEEPATAPVEPAMVRPAKPPVKVAARPKATPREEPPPTITITSPDVTRAVRIASRQTGILVTGVAESLVGIYEVTVNGQPAELDEKGNFSRELFLKVGENRITVAASDIRGRTAVRAFSIHRESGRVMQARKEVLVPDEGIGATTYHALLIAVQDYASGDIARLENPIADARRLKDVLTSDYTFDPANVVVLENPDRRTIFKTLQAMRKRLTGRDSLLIFYAGHGMWMEDMKQGFWLPRDASGIHDPADWIPNSTIRDYIKAFQAKHVLLVADACFGGGIFKVRDAFPRRDLAVEKIFELNSRKAITSGSLKTVPDRSVFVEFLVKRLKDNRDPYLDSQKLFTSLREAVINNSPTGQTPLYGAISEAGDEGGDFVFVRK